MDTLHKHNYSIEGAMCSLVASSGPVLCRDEMEEWSASEANLFEEALDKYGKDFNDIRTDFVSSSTYRQPDARPLARQLNYLSYFLSVVPFHYLQLPWKTLKNIVEYYYMWKTTDRYVQQKRVKAVEAESKLKQVYIPNYTKPSSNAIMGASAPGANIKSSGGGIMNGNSNGGSNVIGVGNDV